MSWIDELGETSARGLARRLSRRSALARLGALLLGGAALPLLPVARGEDRATDGARPADAGPPEPDVPSDDPTQCNYWRHCAISGFLCSCCGGSQSTCPPGTEMSAVTWLGTCHNPDDGKDYVISYNDCCGKSSCGRCRCSRHERATPAYQPFLSNSYNWCTASGKSNVRYHCSTARIVGLAS
jgi:methylamine dehydrogenase light chain